MSAGRVYRPKFRGPWDPGHEHFPSCSIERGCYFETSIWWMKYYVRGTMHQESTKTDVKREAQRTLRERLTAREQGKLVGRPDQVTLAALCRELERHYEREGNRSTARAKQGLAHLKAFFVETTPALDITRPWVSEYVHHRLAEPKKGRPKETTGRGTVRYEIGLLNAAFSVAVEAGLLAVRPMFKLPAGAPARDGFFSDGDMAALLMELPAYFAPVVRFAWMTGWRADEVTGLTWDHIDWEGQVIRLRASETKAKRPRVFPFSAAPELKDLLDAQQRAESGPFVFHRDGKPVRDYSNAWHAACKRAGLAGRIFHDLRRTAARNFRRRGVAESAIMRLCGWETAEMFRRYNIIDEDDLAESVAKRFKVQEPEDA